jgi:hypothetical protein
MSRETRTGIYATGIGLAVLLLGGSFTGGWPTASVGAKAKGQIEFDMVPSAAAAACLPGASGHVRIKSEGPVEDMRR